MTLAHLEMAEAPNFRPHNVSRESDDARSTDVDIRTNHPLLTHHDDDPYDIYSIRKSEERFSIFHVFVYSGLMMQNPEVIRDVYAVARVTSRDGLGETVIAKNVLGRSHAEKNLIIKLRSFFTEPRTAMNLKIWINFSPCSRCSGRLLDFFAKVSLYTNLREIVFPSLYRIQNSNNVKGLRDLHFSGIFLKAFDEQEWLQLRQVLHVTDFVIPVSRTAQDESITDKLSAILLPGRL